MEGQASRKPPPRRRPRPGRKPYPTQPTADPIPRNIRGTVDSHPHPSIPGQSHGGTAAWGLEDVASGGEGCWGGREVSPGGLLTPGSSGAGANVADPVPGRDERPHPKGSPPGGGGSSSNRTRSNRFRGAAMAGRADGRTDTQTDGRVAVQPPPPRPERAAASSPRPGGFRVSRPEEEEGGRGGGGGQAGEEKGVLPPPAAGADGRGTPGDPAVAFCSPETSPPGPARSGGKRRRGGGGGISPRERATTAECPGAAGGQLGRGAPHPTHPTHPALSRAQRILRLLTQGAGEVGQRQCRSRARRHAVGAQLMPVPSGSLDRRLPGTPALGTQRRPGRPPR